MFYKLDTAPFTMDERNSLFGTEGGYLDDIILNPSRQACSIFDHIIAYHQVRWWSNVCLSKVKKKILSYLPTNLLNILFYKFI